MSAMDQPGNAGATPPTSAPPAPVATAARWPGENVLVSVGDVACTQTEVLTPNGRHSLSGTTWIVTNQTAAATRIPAYAIVLAILFALCCLLGLLFLLIKEETISGFMQVSVQGPNLYYATQVPISQPMQVVDTEQRVNYIRGLVAALPA